MQANDTLETEYLPPDAILSFKQGSMPPGISPACSYAKKDQRS